jgi:hypothetical protein
MLTSFFCTVVLFEWGSPSDWRSHAWWASFGINKHCDTIGRMNGLMDSVTNL